MKVKLLGNIHLLGKIGEEKEISRDDFLRFGDLVEEVEEVEEVGKKENKKMNLPIGTLLLIKDDKKSIVDNLIQGVSGGNFHHTAISLGENKIFEMHAFSNAKIFSLDSVIVLSDCNTFFSVISFSAVFFCNDSSQILPINRTLSFLDKKLDV